MLLDEFEREDTQVDIQPNLLFEAAQLCRARLVDIVEQMVEAASMLGHASGCAVSTQLKCNCGVAKLHELCNSYRFEKR